MNPKQIAEQIVEQFDTNPAFVKAVDESPEPYRAMIYESGVVENAEEIDGTDEYSAIVDALEDILT